MTAEEREEYDEEWAGEKKELKADLAAAFLAANPPAAGEAGSACSADNACTGTNHCCGTSTPKGEDADDAVTGKCADKTTLAWTDELGVEYTHVCGAQKLMIAASALFATAYLM